MLLTTHEVSFLLEIPFNNIEYLLTSCYIDGVKIRDDWRVCSDSVREYYVKRQRERLFDTDVSSDYGLPGYDERFACVTKNRMAHDRRQNNSRLERRRNRRLAMGTCRPHHMAGKTIAQLEFNFA